MKYKLAYQVKICHLEYRRKVQELRKDNFHGVVKAHDSIHFCSHHQDYRQQNGNQEFHLFEREHQQSDLSQVVFIIFLTFSTLLWCLFASYCLLYLKQSDYSLQSYFLSQVIMQLIYPIFHPSGKLINFIFRKISCSLSKMVKFVYICLCKMFYHLIIGSIIMSCINIFLNQLNILRKSFPKQLTFKQLLNPFHIITLNLKIMPQVAGKTETVKVVVRCRPPNDKQRDHKLVVKVDQSARTISVQNPNPEKNHGSPVRDFTFDSTFGPNCKQESVFEDTALPIIESVLEGYNGTIFAYGQTGTGKTHTMQGSDQKQELRGIVPRSIHYIFNAIEGAANTKKYLVRTSFLELYNQQLIDLLAFHDKKNEKKPGEKKKLQIYEKSGEGIKVHGLNEFVIQNQKQITHKYNMGKKHRVVAETQMNATSSRSHSIFTIIIQNQQEVNGKLTTRVGKLNLVDLAGSERQSKTGVSGVQRQQAININLSLTTLGLVIQNLVASKPTHIPYRDSQLTRLLQDSLGGNTKTVMIANVGPSGYNYDETLSTLKYANRAKNIKNDVRINQDPKDALLRQFQQQIKKLRDQVAKSLGGNIGVGGTVQRIIEQQDVEQFEQKLMLEQETMKKKFEQQKAEIYKKKNMLEQQKNQLLKVIEQKQKQQATYKQNQQAMIKKLKKMQQKVLHGKQEQEAAVQKSQTLKKKLQQLQAKRHKQRQIEQGLKKKQDQIITQKQTYNSLQQQNEDKKLQIKQKIKRLKNLQNQNRQLQQMYSEEIQDLQQRRRILQKQLKLKNFIIDYFVPADYINMINQKVLWSDQHDDWVLPNLEISGNSIRHKNGQGGKFDDEELTEEMKDQMKLNQLAKLQLENHPNVFFQYSEQGLVRQLQPNLQQPKTKKKKRPQSKSKRKV